MKTWFVTGASSGLGRAIAHAALARGDVVAGTCRTEDARTALDAIAPGRSFGVALDVRDERAVGEAVARMERETSGIDVLVNNAGYGLVSGVEEATLAEARAQFEVNVFGALAVMQAVLPAMRARRAGLILNVTSVSGLVGWPSLGIYSASKFALEGLSETLALELAPLGVRVVMVEPGGLRTDFATRSRVDAARRIDDYEATVGACRRVLDAHAGYERGDPAKAAAAIVALADDPNPPARLLLGADALAYATGKLQAQMAEIEAWRDVSGAIDMADDAFVSDS